MNKFEYQKKFNKLSKIDNFAILLLNLKNIKINSDIIICDSI